jgi:hypothetical protein
MIWYFGITAATTAVFLGLLTLFLQHYKNGVVLVMMRDLLFIDFETSPAIFSLMPEDLVARGFRTDSSELRREWRKRISELECMSAELGGIETKSVDDIEKAKALVLLFSRAGGNGCGNIDNLFEKIKAISGSYGCCSDHTEVFMALSSIVGLNTREVITSLHSVNEIFDAKAKKWIFIDPQLALMARDDHQRYLSLFELRNRYMNGDNVQMEFFGREPHVMSEADPRFQKYYGDKSALTRIRMTFGNNVFANDKLRFRLWFLPKPIRHLVAHVKGILPPYRMYVDDFNCGELRRMQALRSWLKLSRYRSSKPAAP